MGLFRKRKGETIHVRLVDLATGKVFAESDMPIARLPESFESSTTLHLGNDDWKVIEARPMTAAEFRREGKLVLVLSKVTKGFIDPSTVLFSLPTITNDALPPIAAGTSKIGADVIEIHEDDWRQVEWLPASMAGRIESELASVRKVHEHERKGPGFAQCHSRRIPTLLLNEAIRLSELKTVIGETAAWLDGFAFQGIAGIVADSFAVRLLSSIELFGTAPKGVIESVCYANTRANNIPDPDARNLATFAVTHRLLLVDWCRVACVNPNPLDYSAYFRGE